MRKLTIVWLTPLLGAYAALAAAISSEKLTEMDPFFSSYVDEARLAGYTTLVAQRGKIVHFSAGGMQDIEAEKPMAPDSIFRIYSMTKPITGVGMMILWEEGKFKLDDPVSKYIPAFKDMQVYTGTNDTGAVTTEPAKREITILDLMRHTAGLGYGHNDHPVEKLYQQAGVWEAENLEAAVMRVAELPLVDHPGNQWFYSASVDVQGRLIEIISGQTLDVFFEERIFKPLGMNDTAFYVPKEKADRLAELYGKGEDGTIFLYREEGLYWDVTEPHPILSGGGGLLSTVPDYWRFAQMVANGGELDGVRILKPETVAMMTQNQIPEEIREHTRGFGLNFGIVTDTNRHGEYARLGELYWGGAASTFFWIDPTDDIVAIIMTQMIPHDALPLRNDMRKYVYSALEE